METSLTGANWSLLLMAPGAKEWAPFCSLEVVSQVQPQQGGGWECTEDGCAMPILCIFCCWTKDPRRPSLLSGIFCQHWVYLMLALGNHKENLFKCQWTSSTGSYAVQLNMASGITRARRPCEANVFSALRCVLFCGNTHHMKTHKTIKSHKIQVRKYIQKCFLSHSFI